MKRRRFIKMAGAASLAGSFLLSCSHKQKIKSRVVGASSAKGHLLRDKKFSAPETITEKEIVIIGGGVSGLSAARHLHKQGNTDFVLLELENETGGNAVSGSNEVSAYPWGAHYVPLPNNDLAEYLAFLESCNVITGRNTEGLPIYNELFLCFDPEERLYINGRWQEGLVPHFGVPTVELQQTEQFLEKMNAFRVMKGKDGKDAFAIPVNEASEDEDLVKLDTITMKEWLIANQFTSSYLHNYINYCCRDDFGTPHHLISAWTGIHYFASRKGKGANASQSDVLTWPEGNGFLAAHLRSGLTSSILTNSLVTGVTSLPGGVTVQYMDTVTGVIKAIRAKQCIMAVPQFIAARLLNDEQRLNTVKQHFQYCPWMVANLLVRSPEERSGAPASWDNVIYESKSLGYVTATHQLLEQNTPRKNLTYYLPLTNKSPAEERKEAQAKTAEQWTQQIMDDLTIIHPDIETVTEEVNIMLWGHAMAQPLPGFIHNGIRRDLGASLQNNIHFAHTDIAGVSIFEEAFYQGLGAAGKVITALA